MKVLFSGGCANNVYLILPDDARVWRFPIYNDVDWAAITEDITKYSPLDVSYAIHEYCRTDCIDTKTGATIFEYTV
jgi:hypothetical protein